MPELGSRLAVSVVAIFALTSLLGCARTPPRADLAAGSPPGPAAVVDRLGRPTLPPGPARIAPAASYLSFIRGYLDELRGRESQALDEYVKALQTDPDSVLLRHHAAALAFKQGRYEAAVADSEEVLRRDPDHVPKIGRAHV